MRKMVKPQHDNTLILEQLETNERISPVTRTILAGLRNELLPLYDKYDHLAGDANQIDEDALADKPLLADKLKYYYDNPIDDHGFIENMREEHKARCCPMCGGSDVGTLDHLLPKAKYPEFSILTFNLVPACSCNLKKGETITNDNNTARILHPYYDDILTEQVVKCRINLVDGVPDSFALMPSIARRHAQYSNVLFHIISIIEKTSIQYHLTVSWEKLEKQPSLILPQLGRRCEHYLGGAKKLKDFVEEEIQDVNFAELSKNSWASIFLSALLDTHILVWLENYIATKYE